MTLRTTCLSAIAAAALMATAPTGAKANVEAGGLTCRSAGGVGYVIGATLNFQCVFAPTGVIHPGDLAGNYGGVQGNASIGVGVGANALVGGSNNTFALQPVSAQAQTGLNVSAGLADLELRPAVVPGPAPRHSRHRHRH